MARPVFLTGGSGFVGSAVVRELLGRDYAVNALSHRGSVASQGSSPREFKGDLFDASALDEAMHGCDAAIHLVGIIMEKRARSVTFERIHYEGARSVVDAAHRNGVRRFLHMSALGTRPDAASRYHGSKWKAEQYVRDSGLDWTIFRPSLIHGPGGFMQMEAAWARKKKFPFVAIPYFGSGLLGLGPWGLLQPVYLGDVARAFVDALEKPQTLHKTYDVVGPDHFTWPQLHQAAAQEIAGHGRLTMPMSAWFAKLLAGAGLGPFLGFSRDQVIMSQEDITGDPAPLQQDLGWPTRPFRATLRQYAGQL